MISIACFNLKILKTQNLNLNLIFLNNRLRNEKYSINRLMNYYSGKKCDYCVIVIRYTLLLMAQKNLKIIIICGSLAKLYENLLNNFLYARIVRIYVPRISR